MNTEWLPRINKFKLPKFWDYPPPIKEKKKPSKYISNIKFQMFHILLNGCWCEGTKVIQNVHHTLDLIWSPKVPSTFVQIYQVFRSSVLTTMKVSNIYWLGSQCLLMLYLKKAQSGSFSSSSFSGCLWLDTV